MERLSLVAAARAHGFRIWREGPELVIEGPTKFASVARQLLENKVAVLQQLDREAPRPSAATTNTVETRSLVPVSRQAPTFPVAPPREVVHQKAPSEPGSPCAACGQWTSRELLTGDMCVRCAVLGQAAEDEVRWEVARAEGRGPAEECARVAEEWSSSRVGRPAPERSRRAMRGRRAPDSAVQALGGPQGELLPQPPQNEE